jgi:hypothetical protein
MPENMHIWRKKREGKRKKEGRLNGCKGRKKGKWKEREGEINKERKRLSSIHDTY